MKKQAIGSWMAFSLITSMTAAWAAGPAAVSLEGPTTDTDISGAKGTPFTLGDAGSSTQAIYGFKNWEQSDEPCKTSVQLEDVQHSSQDATSAKDLCGGHKPGDEISVSFEDAGPAGSRAFVTAVKVCMNSSLKKVKGLSIKGMKITDDGGLAELDPITVMVTTGGQEVRSSQPNVPTAKRPNCDDKDGWRKWAQCPAGSLATAAVAHYAAGKEPRSLTGIVLKCRTLKKGS
jgi:hypothetical protein